MMASSSSPSYKPLPLKQRTSSVDGRRDYSSETYISLISLVKLREFLITVDHFSIWKRHLAWAKEDGKDLREYMTQRYASSMVFMSLLLSTELGVLFNSAGVTTRVRQSLEQEQHGSVEFWVGIFIIISAVLTLLSLISCFTAWSMVSAVSERNAHCIFRSSIGQYVAELPGRFIVCSIYTFLIWLILFFFLLLPFGFWSICLVVFVVALFVHTITAFSAFGRIIMHTGAMGSKPIFETTYEASLLPDTLHNHLLTKARANLSNKTSIRRQYRSNARPIHRAFSQDELSGHLSGRVSFEYAEIESSVGSNDPTLVMPTRKRTGSLVKFADGFDTNGDRYAMESNSDVSGASPATTPTTLEVSTPRSQTSDTTPPMSGLSSSSEELFARPRLPPRKGPSPSPTGSATAADVGRSRPERSSVSSLPLSQDIAAMWLQASSTGSLQDLEKTEPASRGYGRSSSLPVISSGRDTGKSPKRLPPVSSATRTNPASQSFDSSPTLPVPRTLMTVPHHASRSSNDGSAVSSLGDETPDEKFDREYGDLFDAPSPLNYTPRPPPSTSSKNTPQRDDKTAKPTTLLSPSASGWYDDETRGLLEHVEAGTYSSFQERAND